jgi:hypothetical protein
VVIDMIVAQACIECLVQDKYNLFKTRIKHKKKEFFFIIQNKGELVLYKYRLTFSLP